MLYREGEAIDAAPISVGLEADGTISSSQHNGFAPGLRIRLFRRNPTPINISAFTITESP